MGQADSNWLALANTSMCLSSGQNYLDLWPQRRRPQYFVVNNVPLVHTASSPTPHIYHMRLCSMKSTTVAHGMLSADGVLNCHLARTTAHFVSTTPMAEFQPCSLFQLTIYRMMCFYCFVAPEFLCCANWVGASGTLTSSNSSWPTAFNV